MQENSTQTAMLREKETLKKLLKLEDLAEKKAKIYARLLTEPSLAKEMESLSLRHESRKEMLTELVFGKSKKKQNEGGMSALNGQKE